MHSQFIQIAVAQISTDVTRVVAIDREGRIWEFSPDVEGWVRYPDNRFNTYAEAFAKFQEKKEGKKDE